MTLQIIGIPQSNFVRAVRMVAEEKGVEYELIDTAPHAEDIKAISPTGKVPGMPTRLLPQRLAWQNWGTPGTGRITTV